MNSIELVDPELRPLLRALPAEPVSDESLARYRALSFVAASDDTENTVSLERRLAPGPNGAPPVELLVYRPVAATGLLPCVYHIHGGGFVMGAAANQEAAHRRLVAELSCIMVSVDYRLAPETAFPGPLDVCYAGLAYVFSHAQTLGIDRATIGVAGESAGGGLAAGLALLARDRGEFPLAFQYLIYPMLDDRTCTLDEPHPVAGEFIWPAASNRFGWTAYLGSAPGGPDVSPYAVPARAADLAGLPPTFIATGALDLFVDEDLAYARRLIRAGVAAELHVYPGTIHAFDMMERSRVARTLAADGTDALRRALGGNC